jgi:hypothetical protein
MGVRWNQCGHTHGLQKIACPAWNQMAVAQPAAAILMSQLWHNFEDFN